MNPLQTIPCCPCCQPSNNVGDLGTVSIDLGQEIKDFVTANPLVTAGLVGLIGLAIYEIFKTK